MPETSSIRLGILADAHLAPPGTPPYQWQNTVDLPRSAELLETALAWFASQRLDRLVLLGDLTEAADPASFTTMARSARSLGVPVWAVPGNCDVDQGDHSTTSFGGIQTHGIDNAPLLAELTPWIDAELIGVEWTADGLRSQRASGRESRDARARIVFGHYPVLDLEPALTSAGFRHSGNLVDRSELEHALRSNGTPTIVVHGHLHIHDAHPSDALLHLSCAPLIEPPHAVSILTVTRRSDGLMVERATASLRTVPVDRLPVFGPCTERWHWTGAGWSSQSLPPAWSVEDP
jgi:predicted phosphodiesterase